MTATNMLIGVGCELVLVVATTTQQALKATDDVGPKYLERVSFLRRDAETLSLHWQQRLRAWSSAESRRSYLGDARGNPDDES